MRDEELMEDALEKFQFEARAKFLKGIREHNPDGTQGLSKMHILQKVDACREEIIDLFFYLHAIEQEILDGRK